MAAYWGQNITIDGSNGIVDYDDVLPYEYEVPLRFSRPDPRTASDPLVRDFEDKTLRVLQTIAASIVGSVILRAICFNSNRLTITRLNDLAIRKTGAFQIRMNVANAAGSAIGKIAAFPKIGLFPTSAANAAGSDVEIRFDPQTWINSKEERSYDYGHHYRADDVLLHEMVHALRMMRGLRQDERIVGWSNIEDLISIMISNIYLSSSGRNSDLRGSHDLRFTPLDRDPFHPTEPIPGSAFYMQYGTYIDRLVGAMPDICNPIAEIPATLCKWNPLRSRIEIMRDVPRTF